MSEKPNILIAVPAYPGEVRVETAFSIVSAVQLLTANNIGVSGRHVVYHDIVDARNYFASFLLQSPEFTHILFVDHDMEFRPEAVLRLVRANKDIIGCACPKRRIDIDRLAAQLKETGDIKRSIARSFEYNITADPIKSVVIEDGISEVIIIGMAVTLISREAIQLVSQFPGLRKVKKHYFEKRGLSTPLLGVFDEMVVDDQQYLEDMSFCYRYRKMAQKGVYAIFDEDIGHLGKYNYKSKLIDIFDAPT